MLIQFNFKNFKSFRDDTTIDLSATKIKECENHVISIANERLLPIACIYGANASGKSNVYEAFQYMSTYVLLSLNYGGDGSTTNKKSVYRKPTPFLFDNQSKTSESLFEVYFVDSSGARETIYNYGFTINNNEVCEEWLNYKSKTSRKGFKRIFYRNKEECDLTGVSEKNRSNIKAGLEKETLIVSLGARIKIQKLRLVYNWFSHNQFVDFGTPFEDFFRSHVIPSGFAENESVRKRVADYLASFDSSIIGFNVESVNVDGNEDRIKIDAVHKMADSKGETSIPLQNESAGTLKMFALYPLLQYVLSTGGVLFIDELNARLHPLLVRNFIITFLLPERNPNHAQLIFTSHDPWQLNSGILRRDEIWFTEKDDKGISTLYSLADFSDDNGSKIRKDENYEKNYLLGKYGAIPSLKNLDVFLED